ncbi:MAG: hypothetical protein H8F28_17135 [Fibrella sp.]|nr:hypothetical protein [Armatimonadota bacterium]
MTVPPYLYGETINGSEIAQMAAEMYDSDKNNGKPTQGVGNAGGKPIRPILFGVAAVIALILISLAISRKQDQVEAGISGSGTTQQARYSPVRTSDTATGRSAEPGNADTVSRPTTVPLMALGEEATSVSGSSSLPVPGAVLSPSPVASPMRGNSSAGQNFIAPPGPATNQQGTQQ